jgi:hypothetical protein
VALQDQSEQPAMSLHNNPPNNPPVRRRDLHPDLPDVDAIAYLESDGIMSAPMGGQRIPRVKLNRRRRYRSKKAGIKNPRHRAIFEAVRVHTYMGSPLRRQCVRCKRPPVTGSNYCYGHGGRITLERLRREQNLPIARRERLARRKLRAMMHAGALPTELLQHPSFIGLVNEGVRGKRTDGTAGARPWVHMPDFGVTISYRMACALVAWEMARGYYALVNDKQPGRWLDAVLKAQALGF